MPLRINFLRKIEAKIRINFFNKEDIEKEILRKICIGRGADIGCGSKKISKNCLGVDLTAKGEKGKYGCERDKLSEADFKTSGDNLPMFKNNELDFIVSKHNLEHYHNPIKTLLEWKRVLKKEGKIGVIVPDDNYVNSINLDPTHKYTFNLHSLTKLFENSGFKVLDKGRAIPHWSIYLIAEKY